MQRVKAGPLIYLVIGLLSGACKKDLTVFPANANVDGNLITDEQSAQTVLNGVYYRFADAGPGSDGTSLMDIRWTDIHEHFPSELAGSLTSGDGVDDSISNFTFNPALAAIDSVWTYGYNLVNAANGFIKNAATAINIPLAAKQQMLAEARFLRAFGNSELLFYFGQYSDPSSKYGIILRDTFVLASNVNQPRSSVAAAYSSVLADLDSAIAGLPVMNSAIYFANASAAKLLKARVLMNRGGPGDYAGVIALTNDIVANGPFVLEDSTKDLFLTKGFASGEVMMAIQPYSNESYKWLWAGNFGATDSFTSLLAGDARNQWMYKIDTFYNPLFNKVMKYQTGDPYNYNPTALSENCYAFRLSEAYLLEAEALSLSGGDLGAAKVLLKTVLSHAGAGAQEMAAVDNAATAGALQLEIVKENLRNFVYENGVDWLALRRLPFATIQQLNPNIKDPTRLLLPIPSAELSYNHVIQNPGY